MYSQYRNASSPASPRSHVCSYLLFTPVWRYLPIRSYPKRLGTMESSYSSIQHFLFVLQLGCIGYNLWTSESGEGSGCFPCASCTGSMTQTKLGYGGDSDFSVSSITWFLLIKKKNRHFLIQTGRQRNRQTGRETERQRYRQSGSEKDRDRETDIEEER